MKKIILLIIASLTLEFLYSQDVVNRKAFSLELAVDNDSFFNAEIGESPYILKDNTVQIYPGEKLFIEATLENGKIVSLRCVNENKNIERTIEIKFEQITEERLHKFMMLTIKNPFDKTLKYSAFILLMKYKKWIKTSVLDINPGLTNFESWPDIITSIAINGWELE